MSQIYEIAIEKSILSTIIFDPSKLERVANVLKPTDFYHPSHREVYEIILQLSMENKPIDEEFIRIKSNNRGLETILIEILISNPISNIEAYLTQLRNSSIKRELASLASQIKINTMEEDVSPFDVLATIEEKLFQISKESTQDFLQAQTLDTIEEQDTTYIGKNYIPFPEFGVSIIAAKGGTGKTWTALKIADAIIKEQPYTKVLIIATEDRKGKLKSRANKLNINNPNIEISDMEPFAVLERDFKTKNWKPTEDFYKFKNAVKKYTVVIMDPLIAFYSGEENDNGDARKFMQQFTNLCKKENKTFIFIHHTDKDGKGSRGAGAFADASRLTYFVSKDYEYDKHGDKNQIKELNNNKLRFEVQKENDNIESVKTLEPITKVANIGSFSVEVFPIKTMYEKYQTPPSQVKHEVYEFNDNITLDTILFADD